MAEAARNIGLCLSGGGYRAMLFHAGALWRMNDAGLLLRIKRVSSVSGGSLAAGVLAKHWDELRFDRAGVAANFDEAVAARILRFAGKGVDVRAVLTGVWPGRIGRQVASIYARRLFGATTLGDLPDEATGPQFVFAATNLGTGALWYYSKERVGDYVGGDFKARGVPLATAVAASSAFPPVLSPVVVHHREFSTAGAAQASVRLSDGGVYDNLGLQPLEDVKGARGIDVVLASDGGQPFQEKARPPRDWLFGTIHVLKVVDFQVRKLRRRDLHADFAAGRRGAYWAIDTDLVVYGADSRRGIPLGRQDLMPVDPRRVRDLSRLPTRLKALPESVRRDLVNLGYAAADTGLRKQELARGPGTFPFAHSLLQSVTSEGE